MRERKKEVKRKREVKEEDEEVNMSFSSLIPFNFVFISFYPLQSCIYHLQRSRNKKSHQKTSTITITIIRVTLKILPLEKENGMEKINKKSLTLSSLTFTCTEFLSSNQHKASSSSLSS